MKRIVLILATLVLFLSTADAAKIYVSKAGSHTSPYDTWAKAATHPNAVNAVDAAGDSIIFGAGVFDTVYITPPTGGTAKTVYACSTLADRGATTLSSGWELTGTWTVSSGSIYVYDATIAARWNAWSADDHDWACVTEDGRVLQMVSSTGAMTAAGYAYYDHTNDLLYVRTRGGGSPAGYTIRFSQGPAVNFQTASQDSVIFDHLTFDMGVQGVIVLGSSNSSGIPSGIEIKNCNIRNAGCASPLQNNALVYCGNPGIVSDADLGQYLRMINDTLQYATGDLSDLSEHMGSGLDMYSMENVLCSNLVVMDLNGTGINWKNGYSANVDIDNCVVMDCKISNTMYGMRVGPHCDSMVVAGNQFINCTARGIAVYASSGTSYASGRVYLLNNTLYNIPEPFMISPISTGNNRIAYNVVFDTTSRNYSIRFDVQGGEADAQTPYTETYWDVDSNMYYHGGTAFTSTFTDNNATCTGTDWTAWQACGFDANGLNSTNPNFSASQTPTLTRPSASSEMNYTYLGRTWEIFGALQNDATPCADTLVAPVFESPANGATGQQNSVILDWSDSTQAGTVDVYDLQVDDDTDFDTLVFSSSPTDSRDTVLVALQYATTYYWRVRGRSDCDTSAWSDSRSFTMRAWPLYQDTCLQITEKVNLNMGDTCYCIVDSLLYTFAQRDTLIHTNGYDNIRIWGVGDGIIGYSISDTGSNSTVTDAQTGSVGIHVAGSDNVLIKNLTIVPRTIDDSVRSFVCVNAATVVGINLDNDSIVAGGFSSRAYQQSTTSANRSFNQLLQNSYFGTVSKGYHRRDALYGATIKFVTSVLQSDRYGGTYNYSYKVRNNTIHTIHTGIGSAGFVVDTSPTPDDTIYPLIFIDSNTITIDTRNDLFMTYNDNDGNNSAGDPFGIGVDGVDKGSRIMGNTISSMASTYYGGDGMLLQHIDATVDTPFVVAYNTVALQHGWHPRIAEGRQAVIGAYIRNYDANYFVKGLYFHHNSGYLVVDEDTGTTYAGRYGECVRAGFENGANGNKIENNHFTLIPRDSLTRTGAGALEVSGLTFEQHDSTNSAGDAGTGNNIARYNYWRVPRNPIWLGGTRIGIGADNVHIIGDTCNTLYDGDSTFVRFHQSGTYYSHSINNDLQDMVLQGYANTADVIKGTVTASPDEFGKQLSYLRGVTVNFKDVTSANVNGGTIWAIDAYGNRTDLPNTNGSGNSSDTLRWRFFGYDALPADGYTVADSNAYNNFTFWGKSGSDSASTAATISWTTSATINIQLSASTPPGPQTYNSFRGTTLQGVYIK